MPEKSNMISSDINDKVVIPIRNEFYSILKDITFTGYSICQKRKANKLSMASGDTVLLLSSYHKQHKS